MWKWQDLLSYLLQLRRDITGKNAIYRRRAYDAVINELKKQDGFVSIKKINELNITDHMKEKLMSIIKSKPINISLLQQLCKLPGMNTKKANELIELGISNIEDIKQKKYINKLPDETRGTILLNPSRRIPHEHMIKLAPILLNFPEEVIMVGSFRRELPFSRDFDIMIVSDDENILQKYELYLSKVLTDIIIFVNGKSKLSAFIRIPPKILGIEKTYKFDIFRATKENKYAMLLYSTGSKDFNIQLRILAKKKGYLLNQNGIYKNGERLPIKAESDFFDILGITYLEPFER